MFYLGAAYLGNLPNKQMWFSLQLHLALQLLWLSPDVPRYPGLDSELACWMEWIENSMSDDLFEASNGDDALDTFIGGESSLLFFQTQIFLATNIFGNKYFFLTCFVGQIFFFYTFFSEKCGDKHIV